MEMDRRDEQPVNIFGHMADRQNQALKRMRRQLKLTKDSLSIYGKSCANLTTEQRQLIFANMLMAILCMGRHYMKNELDEAMPNEPSDEDKATFDAADKDIEEIFEIFSNHLTALQPKK